MTIYFSEKPLPNEINQTLRKFFPRGKISSNALEIERANTIDYKLLLNYFDCAIAKTHELYSAAITLPEELESNIPSWFVQNNGEIWVNPNSGPKGQNIYSENLFIVRFNMYIDEKDINNFHGSEVLPVDQALVDEFVSIRDELKKGNEEPIDVFKSFYGNIPGKEPKSYIAKYLAYILTLPHHK